MRKTLSLELCRFIALCLLFGTVPAGAVCPTSGPVPGVMTGSNWDYSSTQIGRTSMYMHYLADLNGDGKADWIQVAIGSNNAWVSLSDANGVPGIFTKGYWDYSSTNIGGLTWYNHAFVDLNGDGKADWIQLSVDSDVGWVSLSDANGVPGILTRGAWDYSSASIGRTSLYNHAWADLNGDGKADWIQMSHGSNIGWVSLGTASGVPGIFTIGNWDYSSPYIGATNYYAHYLLDFNGDHKVDWMQVELSTNHGWASLSGAAGVPSVFSVPQWDYSAQIGYSVAATYYVADFNGDGKADFAQVWNTQQNRGAIYLSGASGVPRVFIDGNADLLSFQTGMTSAYTHYVADLNGDGLPEWIQVARGSNNGWVSMGATSPAGAFYSSPGVFNGAGGGNWDYSSTNIGASDYHTHIFADVNGDGRKDWIQIARDYDGGFISLAPGTLGSCP